MPEDIKKILCVGDSLGLPREEITYEATWFYKLKSEFKNFEFIPRFQRALTSRDLVVGNQNDFLEYYKPDCIIMQVGIVDCAPRIFKRGSYVEKAIALVPGSLNAAIWKFVKKYRRRRIENAFVNPNHFESNLNKYFERCQVEKVKKLYIIKIVNPGSAMIMKNPDISKQVILYNEIIDKVVAKYDFVLPIHPFKISDEKIFVNDGYHLSELGNDIIYKYLIRYLS